MLDRVFLDANVLFSAAYTPDSRLLELWSLDDVGLATSLYAMEEAKRNLAAYNRLGVATLDDLIAKMNTKTGTRTQPLPPGIQLTEKDVPILLAAIDSSCTHLLTGDKRHFDSLFGETVGGVLVQTPGQYLRGRHGQ